MTEREDLRFRTLRPWLLETFGLPVHRIALDAGSSCPNRDGTRGRGGCTYCDVEGSGTGALKDGLELTAQLELGLRRVARRDPSFGVIAYYQSYSNTYVSPERLREVLSILTPYLGHPIRCIALATRPDTLEDWALEELARWNEKVPVWIELGLESADDKVLLDINRLHTVADFEGACRRARSVGLGVVGHAILGLPGDGRDGAKRTGAVLARSGCHGIKVHHLMILKRTQLAQAWKAGDIETLTPKEYVAWLADFVEELHPDQVLHRLTGDSPAESLLAPHWGVHKNAIREQLALELERRGSRQGSRFGRRQGETLTSADDSR